MSNRRVWKPIRTAPTKDGAQFQVRMTDGAVFNAEFWKGPPGTGKSWDQFAIDCTPTRGKSWPVPSHDAEIESWRPHLKPPAPEQDPFST